MKRAILVGLLVLGCGLGAAAQDFIFTNFMASRDLPVAPTPCTLLGPAEPVVYDTSLWLFYTCDTGQVIARRFFNDWDRNREAPRTIDRTQPAAPAACPGGFMAGMYGGCVPPDHPLAKR